MKELLVTDFHLGFSPKSNVTLASSRAYTQAVHAAALEAVELRNRLDCYTTTFCGDLFDKYSNKEDVLLVGAAIAGRIDTIMSGNHDVKNSLQTAAGTEEVSSFGLLAALEEHSERYLFTHDDCGYYIQKSGGVDKYFCCHYLSQAQFVEGVQMACEAAKDAVGAKQILFLHCNVGTPYGQEVDPEGSSLWLTPELKDEVKDVFDLIFVGHEHIPRQEGNLWILGNHFPLSFGEMSDRFVHTVDYQTLEVERHRIFEVDKNLLKLTVEQVLGGPVDTQGFRFVDVQGSIAPEQRPALSKALVAIWKGHPSLLAVRNGAVVEGGEVTTADVTHVENFRTQIRKMIKNTEYRDMLDELEGEL